MSSLVRKHFANYLTNDTLLSDAVMLGADREKNNFLVQYGRNSSKPQTVSLQILYELHKKLTAGLLRRCDIKHIIDASKSQNAKLQKMLQEKNSPPCVDFKYDDVCKRGEFSSIFKLCSYIEGFTYYGLVIDAVDSSSKLDQKEKQQLKELVDELCNSDKPSFNTKLNVSFDRLLRLCVDEYKYVPDEHEIINKKECNTLVEREQIVAKEINMAARSILLEFNRKYSYMHYQSHQRL